MLLLYNLKLLYEFIPEFLISGIIAGVIFDALTSEKVITAIRFKRGEVKNSNRSFLFSDDKDGKKKFNDQNTSKFYPMLYDENKRTIGVAMVTATSWILIVFALIGNGRSAIFLPRFSSILNFYVYSALLILFTISIVSAFSWVVAISKVRKIIGTASAIIITVIFFDLPVMSWFMDIYPSKILIYIFIYFAALFLVLLTYIYWWKFKPKTSIAFSYYASITTYFFIFALMVLKVVEIHFHLLL